MKCNRHATYDKEIHFLISQRLNEFTVASRSEKLIVYRHALADSKSRSTTPI